MPVNKKIDPQYSFRFSPDEVRRRYAGAEDAFRAGDFLLAAQLADKGSEVHGSALLMAGLVRQGAAILEKQKTLTSMGRVCRAYAAWLLGHSTEALSLLEAIQEGDDEFERSLKLKDLLSASTIPIFVTGTMLPIVTDYEKSALEPSARYGQFVVKHVASPLPANAYELDAEGQTIDELIEALPLADKPKLLFALTPQWVVPSGLERVAVPKILWCHDSDHFLYEAADNFQLYDLTIVNNSQEHFELTEALGMNCVSNIMLSPLCTPFPPSSPSTAKDIDVFISGLTISSPHPDKGKFIYQLTKLGLCDDVSIVVVDGYMSEPDYLSMLSRSKFSLVINRYLGCPSPRWRDTLSASASLLYPEGSLYGQISAAACSYRAESIASDIHGHLNLFNERSVDGPVLEKVSEATQTDFDLYRRSREINFELLLKFATFTSIVLSHTESKKRPRGRRRAVWLTPHIDAYMFGYANVCAKIARYAANAEAELNATSDSKDYNNAAKLFVQLAILSRTDKDAVAWQSRASAILDKGLVRYPRSLLLRFNEAYWTVFKRLRFPASEVPHQGLKEGAGLFESVVAEFDDLDFDPFGSDIGLGMMMIGIDPIFPYVEYGRDILSTAVRTRTRWLNTDSPDLTPPRNAVLSLCHGYIGWYAMQCADHVRGADRFKTALGLYPKNDVLLRTSLRLAITRLSHSKPHPDSADIDELIDLYFASSNAYPSVLLTETPQVIPILSRTGRTDEIKVILESWYQLGNVIYLRDGDPRIDNQIGNMTSMLAYREYFPERLATKISRWQSEGGSRKNEALSHFEEMLCLAISSYTRSKLHLYVQSLRNIYLQRLRRHIPLYLHNWLRHHWFKIFPKISLSFSSPLRARRFRQQSNSHN